MTVSLLASKSDPGAEADAGATRGMTAAPLLSVSGLSVSYGRLRALDDINLDVRSGELIALAWENGAGKTTLVRCVAGDVVPATGEIFLAGKRVPSDPAGAAKHGVAVVWQDLALCDNLDVAANILLGRESRRLMRSDTRFHAAAADLLNSLRIPLKDTTLSVRSLSGGQRQLVAVARAMGRRPRLLALDEPTAALGVKESAQVEELIMGLREQGTTIVLACHDIDQMFRLADRVVVLRQGRIVADLRPADTHPDDVVALLSGQQIDTSARRQLTRLHGLTDRLVSADPSSSLSLILSALGAALSSERLCIHLVSDRTLFCAASLGFTPGQLDPWTRLPFGPGGGPVGLAAAAERPVIADNVRVGAAWRSFRDLAKTVKVASSWSVPVLGPTGLSGVITVFRTEHGAPQRDELDLVTVYAGYAASAIERDRLLDQVTTRNRVLETIREMLETLAGPVLVGDGLVVALQSLRRGLQAEEVALITQPAGQPTRWRAYAGPQGTDPSSATPSLREMSGSALSSTNPDGVARQLHSSHSQRARAVAFVAAGGPTVLIASWRRVPPTKEETALMEDARGSATRSRAAARRHRGDPGGPARRRGDHDRADRAAGAGRPAVRPDRGALRRDGRAERHRAQARRSRSDHDRADADHHRGRGGQPGRGRDRSPRGPSPDLSGRDAARRPARRPARDPRPYRLAPGDRPAHPGGGHPHVVRAAREPARIRGLGVPMRLAVLSSGEMTAGRVPAP